MPTKCLDNQSSCMIIFTLSAVPQWAYTGTPSCQNCPYNLYQVKNKAKYKPHQKQHTKQKPHQKNKQRNQPAPLEKVRDMTQKAEEVEGIANNFSHSPRHQEVEDELVCLHLQEEQRMILVTPSGSRRCTCLSAPARGKANDLRHAFTVYATRK